MLHWSIGLKSEFHVGSLGLGGGVYEWIFDEQVKIKDVSVRSRGAVDIFSRTPGVKSKLGRSKMEKWENWDFVGGMETSCDYIGLAKMHGHWEWISNGTPNAWLLVKQVRHPTLLHAGRGGMRGPIMTVGTREKSKTTGFQARRGKRPKLQHQPRQRATATEDPEPWRYSSLPSVSGVFCEEAWWSDAAFEPT